MTRNTILRYLALGTVAAVMCWQLISLRAANVETSQSIEKLLSINGRLIQRLELAATETTPVLSQALVWRGSSERSSEQELQVWVLEAFRQNGMSIRQYQPSQINANVEMLKIGIRLEFTGPLTGLGDVLSTIETNRPALAVANLQIRPLSNLEQLDGETMIGGHIVVWGLLADSDA